ncbi:hypothetical protein VNO77_32669 [Canavalia gladiata]|uniref:Pectinesterase inhibitor domain-containing protein n=1 Tax=Canavalia gladiata TaxID=3824 RepID=A0AAN9Q4B7_CANGL
MVNSFLKPSFIFSFLLSLFLSIAVSPGSMRIVPEVDVCSKLRFPGYCANVLKLAPGADLYSLSQYTINLAHVHAFNSLTLIHNLINTTDPKLKLRYTSCSMDYNDILLCLTQAKKSCTSGDYKGMKSSAAAAIKNVRECDANPPVDPSPLPKNNKASIKMSKIIMILADFMGGKH